MKSALLFVASLCAICALGVAAFAAPVAAQAGDDRDGLVPDTYSRDGFDGSSQAPTTANAADSSRSFRAAATPTIRPTVTCYVKLDNKTRRTYFGYDSTYSSTLNINIGYWNWATHAGNEGQPTAFPPGSYDAVFSIDHDKKDTRFWFLGWYWASTKQAKKCKDDQVPIFPDPAIALGFGSAGVLGLLVLRRRSGGSQ